MRKSVSLVSIVVAVIIAASVSVSATPYKFGVMGDTQWNSSSGNNANTVAVDVINRINPQFMNQGVNFVVQVGDMTDNGSTAGLATRLGANANLTAAGIEFYGLRGNHEDNSACQTYFRNNFIPASGNGVSVSIAPDATSYALTVNNMKLVLFDINVAYSTTAMDSATTWMNNQLQADDHNVSFVFGHKNLAGRNHHDTMFQNLGSGHEDDNPAEQNAFFASLAADNAMYISGHDHMHDRSSIISPDGKNSVNQLICQSDSYKFYNPVSGGTSRYTNISNEQNRIGYYIFTVDNDLVTIDYWHSDLAYMSSLTASQAQNLTFSLAESWSYKTSSVPEPSSVLALLSGLVGMTGVVIRKRRATY